MHATATARALLAGALALLALPASALPVLMEVLYDGPGSDADDAFTEIAGDPGTSLDGWALRGINGRNGAVYRTVTLAGAVIPTDGLLVLATDRAAGAVLAARDLVAEVDWQNGPDALALLSPAGLVVDALQYGSAAALGGVEGSPAPDVGGGVSLSRDLDATDTDDNALDFSAAAPTPGTGFRLPAPPTPAPPTPAPVPAAAVPEPGSLMLAALALGLLAAAGHGRISKGTVGGGTTCKRRVREARAAASGVGVAC